MAKGKGGWLTVLSDALFAFLYLGVIPPRFWRREPGQLDDKHMSENHKLLALALDVLCYGDDAELAAQLLAMLRRPMGGEGEPLAGYMTHWLFPVEAIRRDQRQPRKLRRAAADFLAACHSYLVLHQTPGKMAVDGGRVYTPIGDEQLRAHALWARRGSLDYIETHCMAPGEWKRWEAGNPDKPWRALYLMAHPPTGRPYRPQARASHKIRTVSPCLYVLTADGWWSAWVEGLPRVPSHMVACASYVGGVAHVARPFIPVEAGHGERPDGYYCQMKGVTVAYWPIGQLVVRAQIRPVNRKLQPIKGEDWRPWQTAIPAGEPVRAWRADERGVREIGLEELTA